ncbi:hypothetical protein IKG02_01450 [Candidatus Saccharibacteria bacterium]|nr:hypothetical protein [Candidatus Saccharibacteria bacterium]
MRHRTKINSLIVLGSLLLLATSGSVAYFVATNTAKNIVSTAKNVNIELYELAGPSEIQPLNDIENVIPGVTYSKIPYAENAGVKPVWLRAKLILKRTQNGEETTLPDPTSLLELGGLGENWTLSSNGFYYYTPSLSSGESSEPIFKTVKLKEDMDEIYADATFSFTVKIEATQVKNNGSSALEASWTAEGE